MIENRKKYLKILRIEIEDLQDDIGGLIAECKKEVETGILSNYVFLQNLTIFKKELLSLGVFFKILDSIDTEQYESLDDMIDFIRTSFSEKIKEYDLIQAINVYVERKLIKVKKYVLHE